MNEDDLLDAVEPIVIGSVAITARVLTDLGIDLTFLQWRLMLVLGEDDSGATVSEIACRIGAHLSPTSRLVSRLAARGLVQSAKDEHDRRATRAHLTDAGRALRSLVVEQRRAELRALLVRVEPTAGDMEGIRALARSFGRAR